MTTPLIIQMVTKSQEDEVRDMEGFIPTADFKKSLLASIPVAYLETSVGMVDDTLFYIDPKEVFQE